MALSLTSFLGREAKHLKSLLLSAWRFKLRLDRLLPVLRKLHHRIIYWLFKLGLKRRMWKASLSFDGHLFLEVWSGKHWSPDLWSGTLILGGPLLRLVKDVLRIHAVKCFGGDVFGEQYLVTRPVRDFLDFLLESAQDYGSAFSKVILWDFTVSETKTLKALKRSLEIKILLRLLKPGLEVYGLILASLG